MSIDYSGYEVAVIGMSGKFPKSKNINEYWDNLVNGKNCITFFTDEELQQLGISLDLLRDQNYVKANGVLDDYEFFDAPFFDYSHGEAEIIDPQKRNFMELSWHALEDAGYNPYKYEKSIGLYAGFGHSFEWEAKKMLNSDNKIDNFSSSHLISKDFTPTQISYKLNLKGPSVSVYTACSTSLVAIHNATQAIISGECDIALAGGITISTSQKRGYTYNPDMISSPDGYCRPFDEESAGIVGGNGGGVVVLKLLEDAIKDGDHIYAVIKGSSINNDGNRKIGYTSPSVDGQIEVVKNAIDLAGVPVESIGFVETHGTATKLGDPIEFEALKSAFSTDKKNYCAIGSVKSNIGHCDSGAGVAGFIKTVLCLKNKKLVPTLHFKKANPLLNIGDSPFYVNTELKVWKNENHPLRAGVTSLGIGGTNAHIVLEEYPFVDKELCAKQDRIIILSAKTKDALDRNIENFKSFLCDNSDLDIARIAFTLQNGRHGFNYRAMFIADSTDYCIQTLRKENLSSLKYGNVRNNKRPVVFMFSGQGSQYINMGIGLYEHEPVFKIELDRCFNVLKNLIGEDLTTILYPNTSDEKDISNHKLNSILYSGPIKLSFEYAMSKLLIHYGVEPDILIGHSFGEYVAAVLSGVFKLEDALRLSVVRGQLMEQSPEGAMMSVPLSEEKIIPYLNENISIAAINTLSLCIVSGKKEDLEVLAQKLSIDEVECMMLNVPRAGHSFLMDGILDEYRKVFANIKLSKQNKIYISGMFGKEINDFDTLGNDYWIQHLRNKVNFFDGISYICDNYKDALFVEVSPGRGLTLFVENNENKKDTHSVLNIVKHHTDSASDQRCLCEKLGLLWLEGIDLNWEKFYTTSPGRVSLPSYSFDKYLYKAEGSLSNEISKAMSGLNYLGGLRKEYSDWFYIPSWRRDNRLSKHSKIKPDNVYIIFSLETSLEENIKKEIVNKGSSFIEVTIANQYKKISDNLYSVDYSSKEDISKLILDLINRGVNIDNILYFWSCYNRQNNIICLEDVKYAEYICFKTIVNIVQSLADNNCVHKIRMLIVSSNMESFNGSEEIVFEKSLATGLVKTIPVEFENIECKLVDILLEDISNDLIPISLLNINNEKSRMKMINIIRDNYIWFKNYERINIEEHNNRCVNIDNKTILIVGGLSGIGYEIALDILNKYKNLKLVIVGRSKLPSKENWQQILLDNDNDNLINKIRNIITLETINSNTIYLSCNISNDQKLNEVLKKAEENFGDINIVINSAGVPVGGTIVGLTEDKIDEEFSSKVIGVFNVISYFTNRKNLDFFVNFSSMSAILSGFGSSCYASANSFEDYLTTNYSNKGLNICSINWDRWLQTGMSVNVEKRHKDETGENLDGMTVEEGVKAFHDILNNNNMPNVLTSINDLNKIIESYDKKQISKDDEYISPIITSKDDKLQSYYSRPNLSNDYIEPSTDIEEKLTILYADFFKYQKVGIDDDFFELGGDSLKAMTLSNHIRKEIKVKVPISMFFKHRTIRTLSLHIKELLAITIFVKPNDQINDVDNLRSKVRV